MGLIVRGQPVPGEEMTEAVEPQVIIPHSTTVIETNDHVVFFVPHKRLVREVESSSASGHVLFNALRRTTHAGFVSVLRVLGI